ncbi:MAG: LamB/YcsF family protein, partial [Acidobacteriota bacterium]
EPAQLRESLRGQLKELHNIALAAGATLRHVKPHGALYNDAHRDVVLAATVVDSIRALDPDLAIVCGATSQMAAAARAAGLGVIREAFADRRYEADGALVSRSVQGSLLTIDEAAEQAGFLASDGAVIARDGTRLPIAFDTICIHADLEGAAARLHAIRKRLQR